MKDTQIYYYPVYAYRHFVGVGDAISDIIDCLIHNKEIIFYKNKEEAMQEAEKYLCDDDDAGVIKIEVRYNNHFAFYPIMEELSPVGFTNIDLINKVKIK